MRRLLACLWFFPAMVRAEVLPSDILLVEDVGGAIQAAAGVLPDPYLQKAACAVYQKHPDAYDVLFVFTTIPQGMFSNTPAAATVWQNHKGIGKPVVNARASYCSKRLKIAVRMSDLALLPADPDGPYQMAFTEPFLSGVQVMAHEFGHYWMAYVAYDKGDGTGKHCRLRAFTGNPETPAGDCDGYPASAFAVHWSAFFNSNSVMYGNQIVDLGGGWFQVGNDGHLKYGPLDQYLMGLRAPEEVGPLFLLDTGPVTTESAAYPERIGTSKKVQAKRIDLTVDDVIRAEGPRVPATDPCHWKGAMVLVYATGAPPNDQAISKMVAYANRFEAFYDWATDGRGSVDLTRDGRGLGTPGCPAPGPGPGEDAAPDRDEVASPPDEGAPQDRHDLGGPPWDLGPPPETIVLAEVATEESPSTPDAASLPDPGPLADSGGEAGPPTAGGSGSGGCRSGHPAQAGWLLLALVPFACLLAGPRLLRRRGGRSWTRPPRSSCRTEGLAVLRRSFSRQSGLCPVSARRAPVPATSGPFAYERPAGRGGRGGRDSSSRRCRTRSGAKCW